MTDELAALDVFFGDLTMSRAYVYARLPRAAEDVGWSLAGQVRGPRCLHAETLPLSSPLADMGPGPTLLARALVPDPCFWSPDLPAIYDVTVNLLRGSEIVATQRREIGMRSFGARGRDLFLNGKRWVLRGVRDRSTTASLPRAWHEVGAVYVTSFEDAEALTEASQFGALAAVEVCAGNDVVEALKKLALQPSVGLALIHGGLPATFKRSEVAPNVLLVKVVAVGEPLAGSSWADALLMESSDPRLVAGTVAACELPMIVSRSLAARLPIDQARGACDALQRDLASCGQFAGYIV